MKTIVDRGVATSPENVKVDIKRNYGWICFRTTFFYYGGTAVKYSNSASMGKTLGRPPLHRLGTMFVAHACLYCLLPD